ncbi:hypothetical protein U1Q18_004301 [Sarracenia purpurea var. burkii]
MASLFTDGAPESDHSVFFRRHCQSIFQVSLRGGTEKRENVREKRRRKQPTLTPDPYTTTNLYPDHCWSTGLCASFRWNLCLQRNTVFGNHFWHHLSLSRRQRPPISSLQFRQLR